MEIERIGNIFYRVRNMDSAIAFYRDILGLKVKFRDGDRWTAFDVNGVTFALEGTTEEPAGGTASFRVADATRFAQDLRSAGVEVRIVSGTHEDRALIHDPDGNWLVAYSPRPQK